MGDRRRVGRDARHRAAEPPEPDDDERRRGPLDRRQRASVVSSPSSFAYIKRIDQPNMAVWSTVNVYISGYGGWQLP